MDFLFQYYGLDWLSMMCGFAGAWLITEKKKVGFIFTLGSLFLAFVTALLAQQYGFVTANIISAGIAVRGFHKWTKEEQEAVLQTASDLKEKIKA